MGRRTPALVISSEGTYSKSKTMALQKEGKCVFCVGVYFKLYSFQYGITKRREVCFLCRCLF